MENNTNLNTKRSTSTWLKRYEKWAEHKGEQTDLAKVPRERLDGVLQRFYAELVKKDGKEYESESLKVMIAAIDRYVKDKCGYSVLKDKDFELSRKVLNGKAIELQNSGMGKRPRKADPLTEQEEELLWENVLGKENSTSLNYTMFYLVSQHFGTRGRQEHHQIQMEDLKTTHDPVSGAITTIEWIEGPTKTRQGGLNKRPRMVTQKLLRTGGPRCPVAAYELLVSKRPPELKQHGPLYLAPLKKERVWSKAPVWFSKSPLGVHSIDSMVSRMATDAGLDVTKKHFTNHSIRKTTVKKLKKAGVSVTEIMAITGHKNQQSIADYDELDDEDHMRLSRVLSNNNTLTPSTTKKTLEQNTLMQPAFNHLQPLPSLPCASAPVYNSGPVFNFHNSTVIFGASSSTNLSQQFQQTRQSSSTRKRAYILESDSDSEYKYDCHTTIPAVLHYYYYHISKPINIYYQ